MFQYNQVPTSGDPSNRVQVFEPLSLKILCCRYWLMEKWKSRKMSFPYWRLYWNKTKGAYIEIDKKIFLDPGKIILIPPFTTFSTDIAVRESIHYNQYDLVGNPILSREQEEKYINENKILHLYVHFTLDNPVFSSFRKIIEFEILPVQENLIMGIIDKLIIDNAEFDFQSSFDIYQLILSSLNQIQKKDFVLQKMDKRLFAVIDYINNNLSHSVKNETLAQEINMATNSFSRFFRQNLKCSPQSYIRAIRINKAMELMDHSDATMDEISEICGFTDRFHFSRVFKQEKGMPPGKYKKRFSINDVRIINGLKN